MEKQVDKYKIKVGGFSAELPKEINRDLRTLVTVEVDIYSVDEPDNDDGTIDRVYKSRLVGSTVVQQLGSKEKIVGKSKRSASQRLRAALWSINPDENFYQNVMNKIIANAEEVIEFLKGRV